VTVLVRGDEDADTQEYRVTHEERTAKDTAKERLRRNQPCCQPDPVLLNSRAVRNSVSVV
jgi:hypothetical protein